MGNPTLEEKPNLDGLQEEEDPLNLDLPPPDFGEMPRKLSMRNPNNLVCFRRRKIRSTPLSLPWIGSQGSTPKLAWLRWLKILINISHQYFGLIFLINIGPGGLATNLRRLGLFSIFKRHNHHFDSHRHHQNLIL